MNMQEDTIMSCTSSEMARSCATDIPVTLFNGHPDGRRRAGIPRGRLKDAVELDLRTLEEND